MGIHPFPFRTRKLSPLASMVLEGQPSGRVEHCRYLLKSPQETGGFSIIIRKCQLKKYLDIYVILE